MGELVRASTSSAHKRPGTLWKPGQSGNPKGRPKHPDDLPAICREYTREAVEKLVEIMRSDDTGKALNAVNQLLDRGWGRPITPIVSDQPVESLSLLHLIAARRVAEALEDAVQKVNDSAGAERPPIDFSIPALE